MSRKELLRFLHRRWSAGLSLFWLAAAASPASTALAAESRDPCLAMADTLYKNGAWDASITEYKRYLFFHRQEPESDRCTEQIGRAYLNLGAKDEAGRTYQRAVDTAGNDSLRAVRRLETALWWAAGGETSKVELELARLRLYSPYPSVRKAATLQVALIELREHRFEEARGSCAAVPGLLESPAGRGLDSLFQAAISSRTHSPALARRLSTYMPGLGQFYAGAPGPGIHSLALNGALAFSLVKSILDGQVGSVLITTTFLRRYYRGSRYHAARLAEERNERDLRPVVEALSRRIGAYGIGDQP